MDKFNIYILDDNEFFLRLFHEKMARHSVSLELGTNTHISIRSFSHYASFLSNMNDTVDLVFMDYYLADNINACKVIDCMSLRPAQPEIVVISEQRSPASIPESTLRRVDGFIRKDMNVLPKSCLYIQSTLEHRNQRAS